MSSPTVVLRPPRFARLGQVKVSEELLIRRATVCVVQPVVIGTAEDVREQAREAIGRVSMRFCQQVGDNDIVDEAGQPIFGSKWSVALNGDVHQHLQCAVGEGVIKHVMRADLCGGPMMRSVLEEPANQWTLVHGSM